MRLRAASALRVQGLGQFRVQELRVEGLRVLRGARGFPRLPGVEASMCHFPFFYGFGVFRV